jgi:hypothetical protein
VSYIAFEGIYQQCCYLGEMEGRGEIKQPTFLMKESLDGKIGSLDAS